MKAVVWHGVGDIRIDDRPLSIVSREFSYRRSHEQEPDA